MKQNLIMDIVQGMLPYLNNAQTQRLQEVLQHTLFDYEVEKTEKDKELSEQNLVDLFLSAKRIEGCSEKTLKYYKVTIQAMIDSIGKGIKYIVTDDIRCYLTEYQANKNSSKVTIDNIRRILSSFFSWLEDEDYILKSPVRRIHKVKTGTNIRETYSDEALELILIAGNGDFNVKHYSGKFNAYQRTYVLTPDKKYFGLLYLASLYRINSFKSRSSGSIVKFITKSDVENIPVFIPNDMFYLQELNKLIYLQEQNKLENELLVNLRDWLLPMLMNGQATISD